MGDDGIREWFRDWEALIRDVDYEQAREMFAGDVIGFGTHTGLMFGIDDLIAQQWRQIWGKITDFTFDVDAMATATSGDLCTGWGICAWTSTGYDERGEPYRRPGRATVLLTRPDERSAWRAVHTHLSLVPGTPARTHGHPDSRRLD